MPSVYGDVTDDGAIVAVLVGVCAAERRAREEQGKPIPDPVSARLLIDTGASHTIISADVVATLGLSPTNTVEMYRAGQEPEDRDMHDVSIDICGLAVFETVYVATHEPFRGPFDGLLGRDILDVCTLVFVGPRQVFVLSY